jgi:hypothetical protein
MLFIDGNLLNATPPLKIVVMCRKALADTPLEAGNFKTEVLRNCFKMGILNFVSKYCIKDKNNLIR